MSPVSIMYSLRSYNAGEVVEGVLCESRCSCLEGRAASVRGWHPARRASRIEERGTSARHERGRPALTHRCCGAPRAPPRRPAAGPVARNSVSYKIQIRASHHRSNRTTDYTRTTPRRCSIILLSDPLILFHHQIARIIDIQ